MKRVKIIFINVLFVTATTLLLRTIGLMFQVYLSNKIGPEGMGLFQLILSVYYLSVTLAVAGIRLAVIRLVAEEAGRGNRPGAFQAVTVALRYGVGLGSLWGAILLLSANYLGHAWLADARTIPALRILAFTLPLLAASSVYSGYFTAVRKPVKAAVIHIAEQVVRVAATVILLLCLPNNLEAACLAIAVGSCFGEGAGLLMLRHAYINEQSRYADKDKTPNLLRRMLQISVPVAASAYVTSGLRTLQQLLIPAGLRRSGATAQAALGVYGTIQGMVIPLVMFPAAFIYAVTDLIVPELAECQAVGNDVRLNYILTRVFNLGTLASLFIMGIFFRYSRHLGLLIYRSGEAGLYLRVLAPLVIVIYVDSIVDAMLKGIGQQVSSMGFNILESGLSAVLLYVLLPRYAVGGYIFTIFAARMLNFILSLFRLLKVTGFKPDMVMIGKAMFSLFNAVVITNLLLQELSLEHFPFAALALHIACAGLIYYFLLRVLRCITTEDLRWFKSIFT
ncbi:MAG: oligosaccharide flippase family protein [Firmicutes bacterium]|nr:oligosaccharide flippase family protein [Bacillota bacterium]